MKWFHPQHEPRHPLSQLSRDRESSIAETARRAINSTPASRVEELVQDALFWERKRLERSTDPIRDAVDDAFWKEVGSEIKNGSQTSLQCLEKITRYHCNEIAGNFDDRIYDVATVAVPRVFTWLLRTLSWKSVKSLFSGEIDLRDRIYIEGKLDQLRGLSKIGTVVLVPTHFSNLDSLLVGWALYDIGLPPFCYGAGLNLFTNPIFGFFMNKLGAYKVDRKKRHELYKNILKNYSTLILERGCHSLFFPSGGRSRSGGISQHLKLGLLGTALDAYIGNLLSKKPNPKIFIVPCTISYHFVLEANTLIEDFLTETGKSRYIIEDDESSKPKMVLQFFLKFFTASSKIYMNFGQALDPFGYLVDDEGRSLNSSGQPMDIKPFVRSDGIICHNPQRDREYTRILGERIFERYRKENIALTSHFISYVYFEMLRQKFGKQDLFKLFRLDELDTAIPLNAFQEFTEPVLQKLHELYENSEIQLEPALRSTKLSNIIDSAIRNIGLYHSRKPMKTIDDKLYCEDMKLLYYYHNRMTGYHLCPSERASGE